MYRIYSTIAVYLCVISIGFAQVKIEKPTLQSTHKAFAIFIDQHTYSETQDAVKAYKDVVEKDGLPTYIISGNFKTPDDVKKQIIKLYKTKQSLQGMVFIGEIPIAMLRNAQHLTTAFKMNEDKFSIKESSVPSDRFYDDVNLRFTYLKQDPQEALYHYYKLREDSPQVLNPSLYSARIRYPKAGGTNAYKAINEYLYKVARTRRDNILDHFVAFTGAAYNSECLVAWKDDLKAYKEDFPYLTPDVSSFKQLNFRMNDFMKFQLFNEMQRPEVDVLLMRKHGTPTRELINNAPAGESAESRSEALRRDLYASLRRAHKRGQNVDSLKSKFTSRYLLSDNFFDKISDTELEKRDSTIEANNSIHAADLQKITTQPRYVILDACYNGSFNEDDYIAGHYIFNAGNTIAVQGNTRNVLQDKWTMNLTGLLSYGVRLGFVHNLNVTLESHLIGDPTFHFGSKENENLNFRLNQSYDAAYWKLLLAQDDPIYQAVALRKIAENKDDFSSTLLDYFNTSPYRTVRLQALYLLAKKNNPDFLKAVNKGLNDEYEMIARQCAIFAGKIGDSSLLDAIARSWIYDKSRKRVQYNLESNLRLFEKPLVERTLVAALENSNRANKDQEVTELKNSFAKKGFAEVGFEALMNKQTPLDQRIDHVRSIRNYNFHYNVDSYLSLLNDTTEQVALRIAMAEALGWFNHSVVKNKIVANLTTLSKKTKHKELKAEITQTLIRLK